MDIVDSPTRSRMMAGIRGKDTKPEMVIRRALHRDGFRYRLHQKHMVGRPDITLPKWRVAIFIHGCFWHRHEGCRYTTTPATRPEFWRSKFAGNVERDRRVAATLLADDWRVATVWECSIRERPEEVLQELEGWITSGLSSLSIG